MCWSSYSELDGVLLKNNKHKLVDIPKETELRIDADGATPELEEACHHLETKLEVLRIAMDVGICALCLGFGYVLSRSSIPHLCPPPRLFRLYNFLS
ncbi:unnamed protein product [Sphenostylis stenocarpa]|uniref:Uncharacterized protein n=1 Tax=Sphenostylis stenocarpa TaxID=92480 RepID=A0AA86SUJ1_9FABA|nr:unnamed protein product [Sphenostylis stenocarpa]